MSLVEDIKQVYVDAQGYPPIDGFAEGMAEAITNHIKRQTFRIKKMKAYVEVEQIKTTGAIQADVKETTIFGQYAPLIDVIEKVAGLASALGAVIPGADEIANSIRQPINGMKQISEQLSKDGATLPAVDMSKDGAQGGTLIATGHAYIGTPAEGRPEADTTDEENDYAEIQLLDGEEVA